MNIQPIAFNQKTYTITTQNKKNSLNKHSYDNKQDLSLLSAYTNYATPFLGNAKLPKELRENDIEECNPVNEKGSKSEKLSAVMSTALKYIREDCPVILACSDRGKIYDYVMSVISDENIFPDQDTEINNIILVEDDRILDDPIMFIKDKDGDIAAVGDFIIQEKESKQQIQSNADILMPIKIDKQNIKFYTSDITPISLNEPAAKTDIRHIKKFNISEVFSKEFPDTGNISSDYSFTAVPPNNAKYKGENYPMFSDIGGNKEAIQRVIEDIYAPMVFPDVIGHMMTKGTILEGPPGTGKSMIGQALCNELSKRLGEAVNLQRISGAEMQISAVGGTEAKWRALFEEAKKNQPALILIDEIDACTPKRDESSNARYDNSVVNQILSLMSDLEKSDDRVHVIGMTNRLDAIDPAIIRNGRFGNIIPVPAPNFEEAGEIFDIIAKKYKLDNSINKEEFLKEMVKIKATGATIAGILENAKKQSFRRNNVYARLIANDITKEEIEAVKINGEDIQKALEAEKEKMKKAKISSDRMVIKGFSPR